MKPRIERALSESPFGTELLATVHWIATREHAAGTEAIVRGVHDWSSRKQKMTDRQIGWPLLGCGNAGG